MLQKDLREPFKVLPPHNVRFPVLGLGTWLAPLGETASAIKIAVANGYRHIDCASIYCNEPEVGQGIEEALKENNLKREDLFVVSKLWNDCHRREQVRVACLQTLKDLRLSYLDLYLIHFPVSFVNGVKEATKPSHMDQVSLTETWAEMENLVDEGLVKAIGISNFEVEHIDEVLRVCRIPPSVNQFETHPYHTRQPLIDHCNKHGIVVTAHTSLGSPGNPWADKAKPQLLADPVVTELAKKHNKTSAQVLLRWAVQRGYVVIPKSVKAERIIENSLIFDFELSAEEMEQLTGLNREYRYNHPTTAWLGRGPFPESD